MTFVAALLIAAASHPCAEDAQKLCPGVQPGQGRIAACLKQRLLEAASTDLRLTVERRILRRERDMLRHFATARPPYAPDEDEDNPARFSPN